ncbi:SDR family oxidoreductase [Aquimarina sp. U1-2]|uniref:SDR family NAD(P)-dependent oxidoreductase n=1 Tax=Aquimarina sp. U1-2 TaxID=2823141 RepID=UPI001AEC927A|nr:SDR family NAD(P)-dependent oxidoreductase [Aquimarina sp. U1-2]MBP2833771.1 SDR family oxidoreductase [Aquimarina sp. U1-2]
MELNLKGKKALVTGSTAGIGQGIVKTLAAEGVTVVINGRSSEEKAKKLKSEIEKSGGKAIVAMGDVSSDNGVQEVVNKIKSEIGNIDILVNNAGIYPWGNWWNSTPEEWIKTYEVDVVSNVRFIQALVPMMVRKGWGRVIQISSASGHTTPANLAPVYACTKASQTHMARSLAVELRGTGITVNAVCPAPVSTKTTLELFKESAKEKGYGENDKGIQKFFVDTVMHNPPVERMATVEEIAGTVAYLCSPIADHISGSEFLTDCGYSITGFRPAPSEIPVPNK